MSASLYGPIALDLADGPVTVDTSRGFDGKQRVRLIFGEAASTQSVAVSLTDSPMATLLQLQEAVAEAIAVTQKEQNRPLTEAA